MKHVLSYNTVPSWFPAALPAFPFGVHLIISHRIASHLVSLFILPSYRFSSSCCPYSTCSSSSFLPSAFFVSSRLEERQDNLFPSPPFQGKGPCIISRLRHPSFYLLRLQTPSRAAASNFTHPRRLRTLSLFNHSLPHPHICLIFDYVSFPGGPTVSAHSRLSCYTLGPTVASTVTQNNLARPRLRSRTHTTTTTTTCGSPSFVFCFFWRLSSCHWELHNSSHSRGSCLFWYVSLLAHVNNNINSRRVHECALYSFFSLQESLAERGHALHLSIISASP